MGIERGLKVREEQMKLDQSQVEKRLEDQGRRRSHTWQCSLDQAALNQELNEGRLRFSSDLLLLLHQS